MNTKKLPKFVQNVVKFTDEHSPEILTITGIGLFIGATVKAVTSTPKALQILEEEAERRAAEETEDVQPFTELEVVKLTWKCYIPTAIMVAGGTACLIGSNRISVSRTAAITAAYVAKEIDFQDYREKVIEKIGKDEETEVRKEVVKKKIDQEESTNVISNYNYNDDDEWCCDVWSYQRFLSNKSKIETAKNVINDRLNNNDYVSLSDFYEELGLETSQSSNLLGWNRSRDGLLKIDYDAMFYKGRSYTTISFDPIPKYGFDY